MLLKVREQLPATIISLSSFHNPTLMQDCLFPGTPFTFRKMLFKDSKTGSSQNYQDDQPSNKDSYVALKTYLLRLFMFRYSIANAAPPPGRSITLIGCGMRRVLDFWIASKLAISPSKIALAWSERRRKLNTLLAAETLAANLILFVYINYSFFKM